LYFSQVNTGKVASREFRVSFWHNYAFVVAELSFTCMYNTSVLVGLVDKSQVDQLFPVPNTKNSAKILSFSWHAVHDSSVSEIEFSNNLN